MKRKEALILSFIILLSSFFVLSSSSSVMGEELSLTKIGQFEGCYFAYDVQVENDIAYIADAGDGFWILNVSNSTNPTVLSHKLLGGVEHCVYVENNVAFVTDYQNGLKIFDVSNPINPQQIGQFVNGNEISIVGTDNDIACIGDPFLSILNISDLTHPTEIYRDDDLPVIDLIIHEDVLFCLDLFHGLIILNISNPALPVEINQWVTAGPWYRDIEILDDVIFMASNIGLKALNISSLTSLQELNTNTGGNAVRSLDISDNLLYISESDVNLIIFNITDIDSFEEVGRYTEAGVVINSIFVSNDVIYATAESDGLIIIGKESSANTNETHSAPYIIGLFGLTMIGIINLLKRKKTLTRNKLSYKTI
ncbi:MAG: hypothetical protein KGD59_14775 [Candidatus Heimdallarchaeota archaeon]|nr:hypothetical protein [Candidatus Heimdallarchaeota archaeon]MBY8995812.1 hypothetical protein [Candidatus Heimdallarchaeota archaeon]